jgi:hypothetical protein
MTRTRIESLLASFPKLLPPPSSTQHTLIETPDVRYVYQPLEDLYILLITNKASNILQDIETLHLLARVVSDMCRSAAESEVITRAFELLGAFDEVIGLGYREGAVGLVQVRNALEMESHEEKIAIIIAQVCILFPYYFWYSHGACRTRRPRPRRSSSGVPSSSSSNDASSSAAQLARRQEASVVVEATVVESLDMRPFRQPITLRLPLFPSRRHLGPQPSRVRV